MHYSYRGDTPIDWNNFPERIRLSSGFTRTSKETFTQEEIIDAGYHIVEDPPVVENIYKNYVKWNSDELTWQVIEYNYDEKVNEVNIFTTHVQNQIDIAVETYERDLRLGKTSEYDIEKLRQLYLELDSIKNQEDYPYFIVWPDFSHLKGLTTYVKS